MARKLNTSKSTRPNNGASETLNRREQPTAAALYLMQLQAQALKMEPAHRVRLEVSAEAGIEDPEPVKIVWINDDK